MGKLKEKIKNLPLKKALLILSAASFGVTAVLSIVTILLFSNIRQNILDRRPVIISGYTIDDDISAISVNYHLAPEDFSYGKLTAKNQFYYWLATLFLVIMPVLYIIAGSLFVSKMFYRLKLQVPIESLKKGMEHISKKDLDFHIFFQSEDELGRLCSMFELMRAELYKNNCKMWDMLQERKALTASVSHDLRTPVTVIKGYVEFLQKSLTKDCLTEETLEITLQHMEQAGKRLERYVECVKDIQKIEETEIRKTSFHLKEFILRLSADFTLLAQQKGKLLKIRDSSQSENVFWDQEMVSKVLENIFDNALRFSCEQIDMEIMEKNNCILISIQDDGNGFTQDELKAASSFFYRSPVNGGNFGIGLSISRILCEKLGGNLCIENITGSGAKVTAEFPKI